MLHSKLSSKAARTAAEVRQEPVVYVIDDEPALRRLSCLLIAALGLDCIQYETGEDFLHDVEALRPGCILLDVMMEPMSGLQVQRELRERGISWPVIFMSGVHAVPPDGPEAALGMSGFLAKPFRDEELLAALHKGFVALRSGGA